MSSLSSVCKRLVPLGLAVMVPFIAKGQSGYAPQGEEYSLNGGLAGDQTLPQVAISTNGGYVVWQDNATDGDGLGISARKLNSTLSGSYGVFRVNANAVGNQENAQVALLQGGGAVFVWQGGIDPQQIYARFLNSSQVFTTTSDILVNTDVTHEKTFPAVAVLADGSVVVVWNSFQQDGNLQGVYAQRFDAQGSKLGAEFLVNQSTSLNQRNPSVLGLKDGRFVVAWVTEISRGPDANGGEKYDLDINARIFNASGTAFGNEFRVNTVNLPCAAPALAGTQSGGFMVAWQQKAAIDRDRYSVAEQNGWDGYVRAFSATGTPSRAPVRVNGTVYGDQTGLKLSTSGSSTMVVWSTIVLWSTIDQGMYQDHSQQYVYGRMMNEDGTVAGNEFMVNTTTNGPRTQPVIAADGANRFLALWTSFTGLTYGFDLSAQRYVSDLTLSAPAAPYVLALSQKQLAVSWASADGFGFVSYDIYMDGVLTTNVAGTNLWVTPSKPGLTPSSSRAFQIAYRLSDGRVSPRSTLTVGTTWGDDANFDGLPDDWQARYWGTSPGNWPSPYVDSDGDGVSNRDEFLAGTDPKDAKSVLKMRMESSAQGWRLYWNTQPGAIYQVQTSPNFTLWSALGTTRFAAGTTDSIPVDGSVGASYYRVIRVR